VLMSTGLHDSKAKPETNSGKKKKLGDYRVEVITVPAGIDGVLTSASAVSEHTWQSRELGLRVKNNKQERRLFRSLAKRSEFRGHLMWLGDRPVAFVINTSHDGYLHYEETRFLPELLHLSPGTVLVSELVDDTISCGKYHTVDFELGHASMLRRILNEGHSIGCHTWRHWSARHQSSDDYFADVRRNRDEIEQITGHKTDLFRHHTAN
jgi:hypothetical protein